LALSRGATARFLARAGFVATILVLLVTVLSTFSNPLADALLYSYTNIIAMDTRTERS
jgi:hypothetical protein